MHMPTCLVTRGSKGVACDSGNAFIQLDFESNVPFREFVLAMRPALQLRAPDQAVQLAGSARNGSSARHNRARRRIGRVLKYKSAAEQTRWQGVAEGRDSWRQFFFDSQIAKLVSPKIAILSAYDHKQRKVQVGKFTLCYKGVSGWRCTCPDRSLAAVCVHLQSIWHLEEIKDEPLFDDTAGAAVLEVEPGVLWLVQDQGTSFKAVFLDSDNTVCVMLVRALILLRRFRAAPTGVQP
jgi:hypothetical protein